MKGKGRDWMEGKGERREGEGRGKRRGDGSVLLPTNEINLEYVNSLIQALD